MSKKHEKHVKTPMTEVLEDIVNTADSVSGQAYVVRYNGKPTVHRQNLYEHHGSTAQLVMLICSRFNVPEHDQLIALKRALTHDMPELYLADIPFNSHVDYPHMSEAYDDAENDLLSGTLSRFNNELKKGSAPWHIVKTADCLDVVLFCKQEMNLGNSSSIITDMYKQDVDLAKKHFEELEVRYGRI